VTMMIARKLAIDELHITEQPLPLDNLDQNFIAADALLTPEGLAAQWPKADVIIAIRLSLARVTSPRNMATNTCGKFTLSFPMCRRCGLLRLLVSQSRRPFAGLQQR